MEEIVQGGASQGGERPVVYCLVPFALAPRLHERLRRHFAEEPSVEVVVERRACERRDTGERRAAAVPGRERDRRKIRADHGRRMGERRAALVQVEPPVDLPRRLQRYADQLVFVERLEPATDEAEDMDSSRLVSRFQAGERTTFAALYMRYFDRVYNYLRVVLRNAHDAEDATQEVFTQVYEALPRYERRGRHAFRGWLFVIARNYAIWQLKKHGKVDVVDPSELQLDDEALFEYRAQESGVDWIADRELVLLIERLPLAQRQVIVLRYLLGMNAVETAQILELSPNHVSVLDYRARGFLRERLTALGRDPRSGDRTRMKTRFKQAPVLRWRRFILSP